MAENNNYQKINQNKKYAYLLNDIVKFAEGYDGDRKSSGVNASSVKWVYSLLINYCNTKHWEMPFGISDRQLESLTGVDRRRTLPKVRNILVELGKIFVTNHNGIIYYTFPDKSTGLPIISSANSDLGGCGAKLAQSCQEVDTKLSQSCNKVVKKLTQNCHKVGAKLAQCCDKNPPLDPPPETSKNSVVTESQEKNQHPSLATTTTTTTTTATAIIYHLPGADFLTNSEKPRNDAEKRAFDDDDPGGKKEKEKLQFENVKREYEKAIHELKKAEESATLQELTEKYGDERVLETIRKVAKITSEKGKRINSVNYLATVLGNEPDCRLEGDSVGHSLTRALPNQALLLKGEKEENERNESNNTANTDTDTNGANSANSDELYDWRNDATLTAEEREWNEQFEREIAKQRAERERRNARKA